MAPSQLGSRPADYPLTIRLRDRLRNLGCRKIRRLHFNPPSCILGQIYYDGAGGAASGGLGLNAAFRLTPLGATFPCPDPSNPQTFSGVSGSVNSLVPGIGTTPEWHGIHHPLPSRPHPRPNDRDFLQPNRPWWQLRWRHSPGRFGRDGLESQHRSLAAGECECHSVSPTLEASMKSIRG